MASLIRRFLTKERTKHTQPRQRVMVIALVAVLLGITGVLGLNNLGLRAASAAGNVWAVGNLVGLCEGTQIRTGPGSWYYAHTPVPENNWTVRVIDGPRIVAGQVWWDTSRREAGDVSGGTGWVLQTEADNCPGSGPGEYPAFGTLPFELWLEMVPGGTWYNWYYGGGGYSKDPVQTFTGAYSYEHTDIAIPGRGHTPIFTRVYNSNDTRVGPLGQGWTHNYNIRLVNPGDGTGSVVLVGPQGRSILYTLSGGAFTPPDDVYIALVKNADDTYTATHKDQTTWTFNIRGQLTKISDRFGNVSEMQYDDVNGLLTSISDPGGRGSLALQYDPQTYRLTSIMDWAGRKVSYAYDPTGRRLISVTDREGNSTSYTHEGDTHLITSIVDANGNVVVTNTYNAEGRVTTQKDARGLNTGQTTTFQYVPGSDGSMLTTVTYPTTSADSNWHLIEEDTYDNKGRLIRRVSKPSANTDEWVTSEYTYDGRSNLTSVKDGRGNVTQLCYDVSIAGASIPGSLGNLTRRIEPAPREGASRPVILLSFDEKNNPVLTIPPKGVNSGPDVSCSTDLSGSVNQLYATEMTYDAEKLKLLAMTTRYTEPGSGVRTATTKFEYSDPANPGMVTRSISPRGNTGPTPDSAYATTFSYHLDGMLKEITEPTGARTSYTYDSIGRITKMVDANGNAPGGSPGQHEWTYTYDKEDRLLTTQAPPPYAGGAPLLARMLYDKVGNRTGTVDANGQVIGYIYDERNALKEVRESPGLWADPNTTPGSLIVTEYQYDHLGNIARVTRAKGDAGNERVTDYVYDGHGRVRKETQYPTSLSGTDVLTTEYGYDRAGNWVTLKDPLGQVTSMLYDNLQRLTDVRYSDGVRTPNVAYTYDANNNRTTMVDGSGVTLYSYDELDRLLSVSSPGDRGLVKVGYRYDQNSNRTALSYTDGSTVTYAYNGADQLTGLKDWLGNSTRYEYLPDGNLKTVNNSNGTVTQYSYDNDMRMTEVWHRLGMNTISRHKYALDAVGNRTQLDEVLPQNGVVKPEDPKRRLTTKYEYDRLYRLTGEIAPDLKVSYTYDPAGNRLSMTRNGVVTAYTYDRADRITTAGGVRYIVDANGNLRERGKEKYEYDRANRLINSRMPAPSQYMYDGDGKRYRTDAGQGRLDTHVYDVNAPVPLLLEDGRRKYIWGLGLAYAVEGNDTMEVYHADGLGSVRAVTYKNAHVAQNYRYDAFGVPVGPPAPQGSHNQPFQYTGEQRDKETGFMYLRTRYYDPSIGRFIQRDTEAGILEDPLSLNRYTYVENNPTTWVDPTGRIAWIPVLIGIGAVVNGVGNMIEYSQENQGNTDGWGYAKAFGIGAFSGAVGTGVALWSKNLAAGNATAAVLENSIELAMKENRNLSDWGEAALDVATSVGATRFANGIAKKLIPLKGTEWLTKSGRYGLGSWWGGYAGKNTWRYYGREVVENILNWGLGWGAREAIMRTLNPGAVK